MSPITHGLIGWLTANISRKLTRREMGLITLAGVVPDVDGLGLIVEVLTRNTAHPLLWWTEYHHALHNLGFALLVTAAAFFLSRNRVLTALLAFASFHLHLVGDLVGSRGPDGDQWTIPYLAPFSNAWALSWKYQWELNAWPNFAITGLALAATFWLAYKKGFSVVGLISEKADRAFVQTIRNRFSEK
ncbi:MAG: metal-dependent hydrolase [Acidobacteria bacterium]|nr:metal-dependent hydrolase [Acidobacteriota bacterium]